MLNDALRRFSAANAPTYAYPPASPHNPQSQCEIAVACARFCLTPTPGGKVRAFDACPKRARPVGKTSDCPPATSARAKGAGCGQIEHGQAQASMSQRSEIAGFFHTAFFCTRKPLRSIIPARKSTAIASTLSRMPPVICSTNPNTKVPATVDNLSITS